ncbi:MAG: hypothetical protein WED10_00020 [Brumimicrobium sp.]
MKFNFDNIWRPKKVQVVSIEFINDGVKYHFAYLQLKGGQISVNKSFSENNSDDLIAEINKNKPVIIHFFGKGILNRVVQPEPDFLDKLLINADKNEFYHSYQDLENYRYVSFCRKDKIDDFLEKFDSIKDNIIDCSVGPFNAFSEDLPVKLSGTPLGEIKKNNGVYEFVKGDKIIRSFFLDKDYGSRLFAVLTGYLFLNKSGYFSFIDASNQKKMYSNFVDKIQFQLLGIFTLSFFLVSLLANYFYQGHVNSLNSDLESEIMIYSDNLNKIDLIDQEISRKKQLILTSGIIGGTRFSYYLDQIGTSLPKEIILDEIQIYPLEKKLKQKEKPIFKEGKILISGNTQHSKSIDELISELNSLEWVKKVAITSFIKNDDNKDSFFQIKITEK